MRDWGLYACYRMRNWSQPLAGRFAAPATQGELPEGQEKPHWGAPPCNPSAHYFTAGSISIFYSQLLLRIRKKHRFRGAFSLSIKSIYRFYFSCGSTHKIEFAQQIHNFRGTCTSGIIQGTKNCARRARLFVKIRLKAWFQSRGCSKNGVFRQPQSTAFAVLFAFL